MKGNLHKPKKKHKGRNCDSAYLSTKLNKKGADVSEAMDVPAEKVERRSPVEDLDDLWDMTEDARDDPPPADESEMKNALYKETLSAPNR